jgi:hypothetical protein
VVSLDSGVYASLYTFVLEGNHQFSYVTSNWQGWMLSQKVKDCFAKFHRKHTKSNPFKLGTTMKRTNAIMAGSSSSEATFYHNVIFSWSSLLKNVATVWLSDFLAIWPLMTVT